MKRALMLGAAAIMLATSASGNEESLQPDPAYAMFQTPGPGETSFEFELKGYVFGFRMIKASYNGRIGHDYYTVYSDIYTSGLGALLKKLRIWAVTHGRYDAAGLSPILHTQQNLDKKSRRVEMLYDYDARAVDVVINPPIGSQGVPPASMQERFEADDTVSAILALMMRGPRLEGELCKGTVRVFDSKQHYGLRMERLGPKDMEFDDEDVETIKCHIYYEPISGFDPEDLPEEEESSTPINVYFTKDETANLYIPIRFTYKISGFKATIKVSDMRVEVGAPPQEIKPADLPAALPQ